MATFGKRKPGAAGAHNNRKIQSAVGRVSEICSMMPFSLLQTMWLFSDMKIMWGPCGLTWLLQQLATLK